MGLRASRYPGTQLSRTAVSKRQVSYLWELIWFLGQGSVRLLRQDSFWRWLLRLRRLLVDLAIDTR